MNIHSHFRRTNSLTIFTLAVFAQMRIQTLVMAMKRYNVQWAQLFWNNKNTYHNSHIFINIALPMVADRFMFIYMLEKRVYA